MSRRNRPLAKAARRAEREAKMPPPQNFKVRYSVCSDCGHYALLFQPAGLCRRCCKYYSGED